MSHFLVLICYIISIIITNSQTNNDYPSRLGSTHMAGCYNLTTKPYLIEGVETLVTMGTKVIKLQLSEPETTSYQWNSIWPSNLTTPLQTLQYSYWKEILENPSVETYIMTTYTSLGANYWLKGMNQQQFKQESDEIYDAALFLLQTYPIKKFIFSNWEGDWAIRGNYNVNTIPTQTAINGMKTWYTARQDGVNRARQKYLEKNDNLILIANGVYLAAEVNLVVQSMKNTSFPNTIISVLPYVSIDFIAYSSYDSQCDVNNFPSALKFIADHHNKTSMSPSNSVYIGEFGLPQMHTDENALESCIKNVVNTAYNFGCPFIMFWEVYDNECTTCPNKRCTVQTGQQTNVNDLNGFWLLLPNGTTSWVYQYFVSLYNQ